MNYLLDPQNEVLSPEEDTSLLGILQTMLTHRSLHTEFEPIVSVETSQTFGYEALARFRYEGRNLSPDLVFQTLHKDPDLFYEWERALKFFQVANRPQGYPLFLNLDPHVCKNEEQAEFWKSYLGPKKDIVCEMIENTDSTLIEESDYCITKLKEAGITLALDDIGGKRNLFCFDFLEDVKYLKFDKYWFQLFKERDSYKEIVKGFLNFAIKSDINCILEGVETKEDYLLAKTLGFPLLQGYLFKFGNLYV
ncbi:EAL domain-containing protein [Leptospira ilyithenensis]|uniref:EAL domain-containing protein n=1 Tax=Leptospira ilyithenensis TaxID=2484901 RepID=A0A4R9LLQ2_9LEPT|nr:EAL domain-containing protein [Leptospira ilyithenensis]TGN07084.1 EAL domain-containing protein [Leptospira ilyithenensis]